jgi:hypothetical protein
VTLSGRPFYCCALLTVLAIYQAAPFRSSIQAKPQDTDRSDRAARDLFAEYSELSTKFADLHPQWRPKPPAIGSLLFIASDEYAPVSDSSAPPRTDGKEYANLLFDLAKRAAAVGQLSLAFQWATEVLRENPDQADARRVMGYEKRDGKWLTPYGVRMAEAGKVWHPKFGWLAADDVPRYENGERLSGKRWISAADDAARHNSMKTGWQVRTDHFLVTTNHSLEAAVELAARLERLHQVWRQLFAGFYMTENEARRLFAGEREPRKQVRPFRVYYHRDKRQYGDALRSRQPMIADTLGIYFDDFREAHFYAADTSASAQTTDHKSGDAIAASAITGPRLPTLYHEAVHQLFQETKPSAKQVGALSNFWIIEGIAKYFETLREHRDPAAGLYFTIGEPDAGRLPAARERLRDGFYIPLAELVSLGKLDMQRHAEIAKLYSQSSGFAAFLMDADQGRYREPLVRYLDAVYTGRDNADSLSKATGASDSELDVQYRRYSESLP